MKSPNITSTIGRIPVIAAPTPMPAYPGSEIGVSITRSVPNSCTSPTSVLNGWPASATSSPMRNTRGSRRISSAIASFTASPYVSSRIGSRHAGTVARIQHSFSIRLSDRAVVWSQCPLLLVHHQSEPEPDVMLLASRADFYVARLPEPPDLRLLIEVADSSLPYDRRTKFPLYARAGVTEAWLVDLDTGRVEIHREPRGAGYRDVRIPRADETFSPAALADLALTVRDLLG